MRWLYCAVSMVFLPGVALADREFWVAVGSYQQRDYAQTALARANATLGESFTMTSVDIASGHWYRIVAGPFLSRSAAEVTMVEARSIGFDSAWMLATGSADPGALDDGAAYDPADAYASYDSELGSYSGLSDYTTTFSDLDDGYPELELSQPPLQSLDDRESAESRTPREVVSEAPAGYGLHKLRRGG